MRDTGREGERGVGRGGIRQPEGLADMGEEGRVETFSHAAGAGRGRARGFWGLDGLISNQAGWRARRVAL